MNLSVKVPHNKYHINNGLMLQQSSKDFINHHKHKKTTSMHTLAMAA